MVPAIGFQILSIKGTNQQSPPSPISRSDGISSGWRRSGFPIAKNRIGADQITSGWLLISREFLPTSAPSRLLLLHHLRVAFKCPAFLILWWIQKPKALPVHSRYLFTFLAIFPHFNSSHVHLKQSLHAVESDVDRN